jgi:hypothetical protein
MVSIVHQIKQPEKLFLMETLFLTIRKMDKMALGEKMRLSKRIDSSVRKIWARSGGLNYKAGKPLLYCAFFSLWMWL